MQKTIQLDASDLSMGMYYIILQTQKDRVVKKVMVAN